MNSVREIYQMALKTEGIRKFVQRKSGSSLSVSKNVKRIFKEERAFQVEGPACSEKFEGLEIMT